MIEKLYFCHNKKCINCAEGGGVLLSCIPHWRKANTREESLLTIVKILHLVISNKFCDRLTRYSHCDRVRRNSNALFRCAPSAIKAESKTEYFLLVFHPLPVTLAINNRLLAIRGQMRPQKVLDARRGIANGIILCEKVFVNRHRHMHHINLHFRTYF